MVSVRDAQRITRALEIIQLSGKRASELRTRGRSAELDARIIVLDRDRKDLEARIRARVATMVEAGLEDEVRALLTRRLDPEQPALKSVGYAETIRYLNGDLDRDAWIEEVVVKTRQFAKRQRTWFRGLEKAAWVFVHPEEPAHETAEQIRAGLPG
jgi:tRNA dimethylallyltransferase